MTYEEAREFINRSSQYGSVLGLETIKELLLRLGNPQDKLKVIHVAGTNGKGSTTAFIASILSAQGYVVGRYNSPAVFSYREMIQISRRKDKENINPFLFVTEYITKEGIAETISIIQPICEVLVRGGFAHPTSFEIETAMAFLYFLREKVDFAIVEVGLGGRLDATNVMSNPICCVITSISMDHMQFLGSSLKLIAEEKAGIIKTDVPVITGNTSAEVLEVLDHSCKEKKATLTIAEKSEMTIVHLSPEATTFCYKEQEYRIQLLGEHQIDNAMIAIEVATILHKLGYLLSIEAITNGLYQAKWSGRFEVLSKNPYFIIDGAHNEDAAIQLKKAIELYFFDRRIIYIIGVFADKDYQKILKLTAPFAKIILTITPNNSRALASSQLAIEARKYCSGKVIDAGTVQEAIQGAREEATTNDVIIAFGSLSFLSQISDIISPNLHLQD